MVEWKDRFGNEIRVGDLVTYAVKGSTHVSQPVTIVKELTHYTDGFWKRIERPSIKVRHEHGPLVTVRCLENVTVLKRNAHDIGDYKAYDWHPVTIVEPEDMSYLL